MPIFTSMMTTLIKPQWPAPAGIAAFMTTRIGGFSKPPFDSFNLGDHVGDDPEAVARNRKKLIQEFNCPDEPCWLNQTHSSHVAIASITDSYDCNADAIYASQANKVCVVLTADCLPLLICNFDGTEVAAVHAGWRGLSQGVIESTVASFKSPANELMVWMGAAIGEKAFEVGVEVVEIFSEQHPQALQAFTRVENKANKWLANIYQLARLRLALLGVDAIYGGDYCTYTDSQRFFSYRRDGQCGRMASMIWMTP